MNIEIKTGNVTETWEFDEKYWLPKIVLIGYIKAEIPKGKRKPVPISTWSRDTRRFTYNPTRIDEPNIPTEIRRMALEKFTSMLEVVNWEGRK